MKHISWVIFIVLSGCGYFDTASDVCFSKAKHLNSFIAELDNQDIEHGIAKSNGEGMTCASVSGLGDTGFVTIRAKVFGQQPPANFSINWPSEIWVIIDGKRHHKIDKSERILEGLKSRDIKTKIITYFDREFLVWEEKDDQIVRAIIENRI